MSSYALLAALLAAGPAPAPAPAPGPARPPAEAVKAVWDYFYRGKGEGPVLVEAKLCLETSKDPATRYDCTREVGPEGVPAGTAVLVWQSYLVPQGETVDDLTVQLRQGDVIRETKDLKLKGEAFRTRAWTGLRPSKAGDWSVVVARGKVPLRTLPLKVTP